MATVGSLAVVLTASATDFERTMGRAARAVRSTEKEFKRSAVRMERIGRDWMWGVTVPIVAGIATIGKAAMGWESAFTGVKKTVNATEEELAQLERSLRNLAKTIPVSHQELAGIAETAGQLGIHVQNIKEFTRVIAMMGAATTMTSEEIAIGMAQIANVMQTGQKRFDQMGATIVHLGNNLNTNEAMIMEFSKRIAAAGRIAGLTEAQVLSIAGAFASAGIEAEAGGTAVSKVLAAITEAVATGNAYLQGYAAVSGMSASEFAAVWQKDAGTAFAQFVEGLGKSGKQAYGILRELGLNDERLKRAFLSAAGAQTSLISVMEMGSNAWAENNALVEEAAKRFQTGISRLKKLWNRIYDVAIVLGDAFAPMMGWVITRVENLLAVMEQVAHWFAKLPEPVRIAAASFLLLLAAIGPTYLALGFLNKTIGLSLGFLAGLQAFAANAAFAFAAWRGGAATLGQSLVFLVGGPIKAAILGIGAVITVGILLLANWDQIKSYAIIAWNAISAAIMYGASFIVRGIGLIITAIGFIVPSMRSAGQALLGLANHLKSTAGQALSSARSTATAIKKAADSQQAAADAGQKAQDAQDGLANSIDDVGKAIQANLQSFDEVHQIQDNMSASMPVLDEMMIPEYKIPDIPGIGIGDMVAVGDQIAKAVDSAASAWGRLKQAMAPVNHAVQWIREHWPSIKPIIEDIASVVMVLFVPALVKSGVEAMLAAGKQVAAWVMSGVAALVQGATIVGQLIFMIAKWTWAGIQALIHAGKIALGWALQGMAAVVQGAIMIGQLVLVVAKWAWAGVQALLHAGKMALAWVIALGPIAWITAIVIALAIFIIANWEWVKEKTVELWGIVATWLANQWDWIKEKAGYVWQWISEHIIVHFQNAWDSIKSIWNNITGFLSGTWDGIKRTASRIWEGITDTIKGAVEGIIGFINTFITAWNDIKLEVPKVTIPLVGEVGGWTVRLPQIDPIRLATGTNYVPQDMLAYLHEGEAIVPKKFNPAVSGRDSEEIAQAVYRAMIDAIRISQASQQSEEHELVLKLDTTVVARELLTPFIKEAKRQGMNLVVQPQGV